MKYYTNLTKLDFIKISDLLAILLQFKCKLLNIKKKLFNEKKLIII